jgi:hypothetical protein
MGLMIALYVVGGVSGLLILLSVCLELFGLPEGKDLRRGRKRYYDKENGKWERRK